MAANDKLLDVTFITPKEVLFEGSASHVIFPGEEGVFEICPFHKSFVSRLLPGTAFVDDQLFKIQHGVVKVDQNVVTALVQTED